MFKRSFGVDIASTIAIVSRVRIDNSANRTLFARQLGFDATPGLAVFGDHNFSCDADAMAFKQFIVLGNTVVDEYQFALNFAINGKGVVRWQQVLTP